MTSRGTFVAPVHDLDVIGRDFTFQVTAAWVRGALEGCEMQPAGKDGIAQMHLSKSGNDVLVRGQLEVDLAIPCARCLEPVILHPKMELALLLRPAPTAGAINGTRSGGRGHEPGARTPRAPAGRAPSPPAREGAGRAAPGREGSGIRNKAEEAEFSEEEADLDTYEDEEVVLDRFFREAILL